MIISGIFCCIKHYEWINNNLPLKVTIYVTQGKIWLYYQTFCTFVSWCITHMKWMSTFTNDAKWYINEFNWYLNGFSKCKFGKCFYVYFFLFYLIIQFSFFPKELFYNLVKYYNWIVFQSKWIYKEVRNIELSNGRNVIFIYDLYLYFVNLFCVEINIDVIIWLFY